MNNLDCVLILLYKCYYLKQHFNQQLHGESCNRNKKIISILFQFQN